MTTPENTQDPIEIEEARSTNRRGLMKVLGAAAAGAVVAVAIPGTADAAEGGNVLIGATNDGTSDTVIRTLVPQGANILTATDASAASSFPSALGGFAYGASVHTGVYAYTNSRPPTGTESGYSLLALATAAGRAPMRLYYFGGTDPRTDTFHHNSGEITIHDSDVYVCVESGIPGSWRRIAGPATAGSFHAIDPIRVFDSRNAAYGAISGTVAAGSSRLIPVKDARNAAGAVTTADAIPAGATAVAINLTITGPTAAGFASVTPGDATSFTASSINFQAGADIANAFPAKLDATRQLKIWMGPGTSAHAIIDVQGYYL